MSLEPKKSRLQALLERAIEPALFGARYYYEEAGAISFGLFPDISFSWAGWVFNLFCDVSGRAQQVQRPNPSCFCDPRSSLTNRILV